MLSDADIRKALVSDRIRLDPWPPDDCIQPASVDVHLAAKILIEGQEFDCTEGIELPPHTFALGSLLERLTLSDMIVCRVEGKSSNGRKGLGVHITAGFVDPGWDGNLTLEFFNFSRTPIHLKAGMKIAQLAFDQLITPAIRPYGSAGLGSHYQGDTSAQEAKA